MKAKTTKFLAVLAVLAMAFAGVAVLAQEQINDADEVTATTSATYAKDYASDAGIIKIQLEETPSAKSVVLYKAESKDDKGATIPATKIANGMAYYVNVDSTIVIPSGDANTWDKAIFTFFVLEDVEVNFVTANPLPATPVEWNNITGVRLISVASEDNGVITLNEARAGDNAFAQAGYAGAVVTNPSTDANYNANLAEFLGYAAIDKNLQLGVGDYSVAMKAKYGVEYNFYFSNAQIISVVGDSTIEGNIPIVYFPYTDTEVKFENFTGTITNECDKTTKTVPDTANSIKLEKFTGVIKSAFGVKTPLAAETDMFVVKQSDSGEIKATSTAAAIALEKDVAIEFAEGATVGGVFGYKDGYGDWHAMGGAKVSSVPMTVGINGLSISSGVNMLRVNGTVQLEDATTLTMMGNVVLSGMIYTTEANTLTLANSQADIKLAGLQVVGAGSVTLGTSALVTANTSFYVKGALALGPNAVLKVAEGAVMKAEGALTMDATANIWNAGQVIVPNYIKTPASGTNAAVYYDAQLIRVYMNSAAGTGKFFAGSVEYDGTDAGAPLAIAYGAYLDITGKCSVNLTSNNITVVNNLYKYNTMILATKNTTIPLTVDYDNQYSSTIDLTKKSYSTRETTAKSATFRNVVWETPTSAVITVVAPEVYSVVLAKTYDADGKITEAWTTGLTVKDPQGRIIPISQATEDDASTTEVNEASPGGVVKLVYGTKYTITGNNDANDYSFVDVKNVFSTLKKDSQTQGSFTMIRNLETDGNGKEIPAEIYVKEGKATVVTVDLTDAEKRIAAGDVILSYSVDDGKTYKDVVKPAAAADKITFTIFSNQTVLLKYPAIEFFKFSANLDRAGATETSVPYNVENLTVEAKDATDTNPLMPTAEQRKAGYVNAFGIKDSTTASETAKVKATIGIICELDAYELEFVPAGADKDAILTITFEEGKYYTGTSGHDAVVKYDFSEVNNGILTVYKGEVFSMSWTDVPDVREKMTYVAGVAERYSITVTQPATGGTIAADATEAKAGQIVTLSATPTTTGQVAIFTVKDADNETVSVNDSKFTMPAKGVTVTAEFADANNTPGTNPSTPTEQPANDADQPTGTEYKSGTAFTVDNSYTFTLTLTEIKYVDVKNSTATETVITDNDVAKDGVTLEAQKLKEKAIEQCDNNIVELSIEGSYVISWSYKLTVAYGDASTTTVEGTVSGAAASFNFENYPINVADSEAKSGKVTVMEITTINAKKIVYFVHTQTTTYTKFDRGTSTGGYYGETMYIYPDVQEGGLLKQIRVYYEISDGVLSDKFFYAEKTGTYWTFKLPASSVTLVPEDESNVANIKFVNYDGTVLQDTEQPKGAMPVYSGPTPTKPATETEVYVFAGWEPALVEITEDATYTATFNTVAPTSKDVSVTIGQKGEAINVILFSLDGGDIGTGSIELLVWFTYIDEEGDIMTDKVKVPLTYSVEGKTANVIVDTTFIQLLGDNYGAAYAVTGTYTLGAAQGDIIRTAYTPVEA